MRRNVKSRKGRRIRSSSGANGAQHHYRGYNNNPTGARPLPRAPVNNLKRKRVVGAPVNTKRKKRSPTDVGTAQVSSLTRKYGRRPRNSVMQLSKLVNDAVQPNVYRWQGLTDFDAAQGYFKLDRLVTGAPPTAASIENMPLWLFELTGVPQNAGQISNTVGYRLQYTFQGAGVQPLITFATVNPLNQTGVAAGNGSWQYENTAQVASTGPGRKDIFSWLDAKLICVGATQVPTKFTIDIVQFKEDYLIPQYTAGNLAGSNDLWNNIRSAVYERLVLPYATNPINTQHGMVNSGKKFIKKLHSVSFWIQPKTNVELDPAGDYKIVKLFKWINRVQNYAWSQATRIGQQVGAGGAFTEGYEQNINQTFAADVTPGERIYLMVRATNQTSGQVTGVPATEPDRAAVCPTFDLVLRKQHLANAQVN